MGGWLAGKAPAHLGVRDGRLAPCPQTPNCVSSYAEGRARVAAIAYRGDAAVAMARLRVILAALPRVRITQAAPDYLRAEARSRWLGFVDDLELQLDAAGGVVHVRSASRLGHSDFGVNRRRVEAIRAAFDALPGS
jgi:uncharacterized protein (DUF1499 family)